MPDNSFAPRVKALAYQSGLKIAEVSAGSATLIFTFDRDRKKTSQKVWVIPYEETWEFSCLSFVRESDPQRIAKELLVYALQQNSKNRRGFWTINYYSNSGNHVLEYMDNISGSLLTPDEFGSICWAVAKNVDQLERILKS